MKPDKNLIIVVFTGILLIILIQIIIACSHDPVRFPDPTGPNKVKTTLLISGSDSEMKALKIPVKCS